MKYIFRCFASLEIKFHALLNQGRVVFVSLRWGRFAKFDTELQYNKKKYFSKQKKLIVWSSSSFGPSLVIFWSTK